MAECAGALQDLAQNNLLQLQWVPAHCGIVGNEEADQLAWEASQLPHTGPEPVIGVSLSLVQSSMTLWAHKELQDLWKSQQKCRQAKLLIPGPDFSWSKRLLRLSRKQIRLLIGLLSGHWSVNQHLYRMGLVNDGACPLCLEEAETTYHFLGECDALIELRVQFLGARYLSTEEIHGLNLGDILGFYQASGRFS